MQGDVIPFDAKGVALADEPISHASTADDDGDRAVKKAAALAHVVEWAIGLRSTSSALEITSVARCSSLLCLSNKLADLGEVAGASDAVAIEVNNDAGGMVLSGKTILNGLEFSEVQMIEVGRDL